MSDADRVVVVADDQPERAASLRAAIEQARCGRARIAADGKQAVALGADADALVVRADMRDDAIQVLRELSGAIDSGLPVLVVTDRDDRPARRRALAAGARDLVVANDGSHEELVLKLTNVLDFRDIQNQLEQRVAELEQSVARVAHEANEVRHQLEVMHLEALHRLALAAEYRDDAAHEHPQRVARTAALIAQRMRLPDDQGWILRHAAQLHDIGKIGVPDEILLKPGPLDPDEFELMKTHTVIGWQMLSGSSARVLAVAAHIALSHHERFDGRGYPNLLAGDAIPLPARITAVADVFDTLTHVRPYRDAFTIERAVDEVRRMSRSTFDPRVVGAFELLDHAALLGPVDEESLEAAPI
ncbi:MAG TPA: HD domain-containing phosphohydrolase [Thermoleophilaceae bacterium]|nr:HD domain-containing phosphohydrolase [Thermoleophilaceae bacterium]